jgi:FkbM family methyltransferase
MADWYGKVTRAIHSSELLTSIAKRAQFLWPDTKKIRDVPDLGPFQFRMRRHRWFLGLEPMRGHLPHIELYKRLLAGREVAYDIGANIGYYTRPLVKVCGAKQVIAFEPMSENLELLRKNVELGGIEANVRVLDLALSDRDGEEALQIDDMSGGSAVLDSVTGGAPSQSRRYFGLAPKTENVRVAKLDTLVKSLNLPAPTLMKIDVEGAEASVLRGARDVLTAHRPRLAIALHGDKAAQDTFAELLAMDYLPIGYTRDNATHRVLKQGDALSLGDNNIVAWHVSETIGADVAKVV